MLLQRIGIFLRFAAAKMSLSLAVNGLLIHVDQKREGNKKNMEGLNLANYYQLNSHWMPRTRSFWAKSLAGNKIFSHPSFQKEERGPVLPCLHSRFLDVSLRGVLIRGNGQNR